MRLFFFQNDGIGLDHSVRSRERTIVPQERRPTLVVDRALESLHGGSHESTLKVLLKKKTLKLQETLVKE